ncbi:thrombospondin type 3 repeat-containing protein [Thermodesulfobacteriota bacterium]
MNDSTNLYFMVYFPTYSEYWSFAMISFDNDNDDTGLSGDDGISLSTTIDPHFRDWYWTSTWPCGSDAGSCQFVDSTQNGSGQLWSFGGDDLSPTGTVYTFSHPINSGDVNDLSISTLPATVGFQLSLFVYHSIPSPGSGVATDYPTTVFDVANYENIVLATSGTTPPPPPDLDLDGIPDNADNCPYVPNSAQKDWESDGVGDACDNCTYWVNPDQEDNDDIDGPDGIGDICDNCRYLYNPGEEDADGDHVGDACDNCPSVSNPDQTNSDTDSYGDACDNCPENDNESQLDTDGDLLGDACDPGDDIQLTIEEPPVSPTRPGEPIWYTTTLKFEQLAQPTQECIYIVKPTCFNVYPKVTLDGSPQKSRCLLGPPVVWETDVIPLCRGEEASVTCDITETYPELMAGTLSITAYYNNYLQYDPTNPCPGCQEALVGTIISDPTTVVTHEITGDAVVRSTASISFNPNSWDKAWAMGNSPPISAKISNIYYDNKDDFFPPTLYSVNDVDVDSIRLNGSVPIIPDSARTVGDDLYVWFDRAAAVASLGDNLRNTEFVRIQGNILLAGESDAVFAAQSPVVIVENTGTFLEWNHVHTVGCGENPGAYKAPNVGMIAKVFDASSESCAGLIGIEYPYYGEIYNTCESINEVVTHGQGEAIFALPEGDYVVIGHYTEDNADIYVRRNAHGILPGKDTYKHSQVIIKCDKKKVSTKCSKYEGSELLLIEPEYVEWSSETELYPFIFESVGDWTVTTSVTPPEGFVADNEALSAAVNNEIEVVQFTITDIGSRWIPTKVKHKIKHKKQKEITVTSEVGIKLTPELAQEKGVGIYGEDSHDDQHDNQDEAPNPGKGKKK